MGIRVSGYLGIGKNRATKFPDLPISRFPGPRAPRSPDSRISRSPEHGFTLVEMLIVIVLLFIVGGGMLSTFLTGQASFMSGEAYVQVQQEARRAFDVMVRELREAQITTLTNPKQINFQVALGYNDRVACQNPARTCWGGENVVGKWLHYAIIGAGSAAQLVRYVDTSATGSPPATCVSPNCRVLANNIRFETDTTKPVFNTFAYDSTNKVVTITLQIERNNSRLPGGRQATPVLSSRVKLRN